MKQVLENFVVFFGFFGMFIACGFIADYLTAYLRMTLQ